MRKVRQPSDLDYSAEELATLRRVYPRHGAKGCVEALAQIPGRPARTEASVMKKAQQLKLRLDPDVMSEIRRQVMRDYTARQQSQGCVSGEAAAMPKAFLRARSVFDICV